jgi:hypothetical protein
MKKQYIVEKNNSYSIYCCDAETREDAIINAIKNEFCKSSEVERAYVSPRYRAYCAYYSAISRAGNLTDAALLANKKGYNWACDFTDAWHEAREELNL